MKRLFVLFAILLLIPSLALAGSYLSDLQSDARKPRVDAAKRIYRSSTPQDAATYAYISSRLQKEYNKLPDNRYHADEMSWWVKALATSGKEKYRPLLKEIASNAKNRNLKRHAQDSLSKLSVYAKRYEIKKSKGDGKLASLDPKAREYVLMIQSGEPKLQREAAKRIMRAGYSNEVIYDVVAETLLAEYPTAGNDRHKLDALAWMCKCLGASGNTKYRKPLETVAENAHRKIAGHAKKSLKQLY